MSSGIPKVASSFGLSDANCLITGSAMVKVEEPTPVTVKPRIPATRSKLSGGTKRKKTTKVAYSESSDILDTNELFKRLRSLHDMHLNKLKAILEASEKQSSKMAMKIEDMQKVAAARSEHIEQQGREISSLHKQYEDLQTGHAKDMQEIMNEAKRSVALSVLQSRIQMAHEALKEGNTIKVWDVQGWKEAFKKLGGEFPDSSKSGGNPEAGLAEQGKVAEGDEDGGTKKVVELGNEG